MAVDPPSSVLARIRLYTGFVREIVGLHRRLFVLAVLGAFVYAIATVASSMAVRWVIDRVIEPRFTAGSVATGTLIAGCALVIGIGIIRSAGVVMRRTFAGMAQWRIGETLSDRVAGRLVRQPVSWQRRQSDGQLLARAGVDVDTTVAALAPIPFATGTIVLLVVAGAWLLVTDIVMGLAAVAVFPLLIVLNVIYQQRVERHFDAAQQAIGSERLMEAGVTLRCWWARRGATTHRLPSRPRSRCDRRGSTVASCVRRRPDRRPGS